VAGRRLSDGNDAAPTGRGHGSLKMARLATQEPHSRSVDKLPSFWTSQGFEATGELRRRHEGTVESEAVYLEKRFS